MQRSETHVKETIACRAFESALDPSLLAQPTRQGMDYGVDYTVSVYDNNGLLTRTFYAQVKYLNARNVSWVKKSGGIRDFSSLVYPILARVRYDKEHIRSFLDRKVTPVDTLLVVANEKDLFAIWINDLYKYYLRWFPNILDGSGTLTLSFSGVRSSLTSEMFLVERRSRDWHWLDKETHTQTIDSLENVATIAYLETANRRNAHRSYFDSSGYWSFVLQQSKNKPWLKLILGKHLALIPVTTEMTEWAIRVLKDWKSVWDIPVAFYLLSGSSNECAAKTGIAVLKTIASSDEDEYWDNFNELADKPYRVDFEYLRSIAQFLATCVDVHRLPEAQRMLIMQFANFHYSNWNFGNVFATALISLVQSRRLLRSEIEQLHQWCNTKQTDSPSSIVDGINETLHRWNFEQMADD